MTNRSFLKSMLLAVGFLSAFAPTAVAQYATEFRIALSKSGYKKVKVHLESQIHLKKKERKDSYFDVFSSGQFLLKYRATPFKLRLMKKAETVRWQVSTVVNKRKVLEAGLDVGITESRFWRTEFEDDADWGAVMEKTDGFFSELKNGGQRLREVGNEISSLLKNLDWRGKDEVLNATGQQDFQIYPAAINYKSILYGTLPVSKSLELKISLRITEARNELGEWIELYEIEAEPTSERSPHQLWKAAKKLARNLALSGLTGAETGSKTPDAFEYTRAQLEK